MELRDIKTAAFLSIFTALIPAIIIFLIIRIKQIKLLKRFFYSYLSAYIPGFIYTIFTVNSKPNLDTGNIFLLHFIGAISCMLFLKRKYTIKAENEKNKIIKDFTQISDRMNKFSFITFVKQNFNIYHIIIFFLISTVSVFAPLFLKIDLNSGFNFADFHKIFYTLFFLNLLPWIFLVYLSYSVRKNMESTKIIKSIDYFVAVLVGGFFVSLSLLPILFILLFIILKLDLFNPNSFIDPHYFTIILLPFIFLFTFYAIGAFTNILIRIQPTFSIKKALFVFQKPFIQLLLKWSILFLLLPLLLPIICNKLNILSPWNKFTYYYLSLTSSLIITYLSLYFVKIFEIESFEL